MPAAPRSVPGPPFATMETIYVIGPLLLLGVILAAVWLERFGVPVILVALGLGLLAGSDLLGLWHFDDVELSNRVANASLVFILFQGGLATRLSTLRAVALPAGSLATLGVALTAVATFAALHLALGWDHERALLIAAVIASTDAAATFSILRRQALPMRLSSTIGIESAANDPMAILMTLVVVESLTSGASLGWSILPLFVWKFVAGPAVGYLLARLALIAFDRLNPQDRGYYYVLLIAIVLLTFGLAELARGSGMLAVYTAGLVMGNRRFIYQQGVRNFSVALAMIANVGVFVMMGLLVFPSQWGGLWLDGAVLFAVLTFVARPVAVWLGTLGMGFGVRERGFMCWAGLRGAVPIVLATYPMAAGLGSGQDVFNLVFVAVILSVSLQGSTLGWLARRLGLSVPSRPEPRYGLELVTMAHSELDLIVVDLPGPAGRPGPRIRDLTLPPGSILTLVTRGDGVVAPSGNTRLHGYDRVTVLARPEDEPEIRSALLEAYDASAPLDDPSAARFVDPDPAALAAHAGEAPLRRHAVLLGHGTVGAVLARFLRQRGLPFVVIEQDLTTVTALRRAGVTALHGRGEDPALLERARIADAALLLVTATHPVAARRAIDTARRTNPDIEVVARVHHEALARQLEALPRTRAIEAHVELAYAMARAMLLASGVSAIETEALLIDARRGERAHATAPTRILELHVPESSPVAGRRLADLDLPTGTLIVTVARDGDFVVPGGQTELRAGDALLLLARASELRALEAQIRGTPPAAAADGVASA